MGIKEKAKKFYNRLDYSTDGLINRIVAAHGLGLIITSIDGLFFAPVEMKWFLSAVFALVSIPIVIGYIIIKLISMLITLKFKIPVININIYLITGIIFIIIDYIIDKDIILTLIITGFTALTILLLKTPFLPECKLKTYQEKLEKNVIKISFIAFIIYLCATIIELSISLLLH